VLAISAPGDASTAVGIGGDQTNRDIMGAGAVYVYRRDLMTLEWETEPAYVKASNTKPKVMDRMNLVHIPNWIDDYFGRAVALSGDGRMLAVGAPNEDSSAIGLGGDQSYDSFNAGAVYMY
jgi:hypothetical protein